MGVRSLLTLLAVWCGILGMMAPPTLAAEADPPVVTVEPQDAQIVSDILARLHGDTPSKRLH